MTGTVREQGRASLVEPVKRARYGRGATGQAGTCGGVKGVEALSREAVRPPALRAERLKAGLKGWAVEFTTYSSSGVSRCGGGGQCIREVRWVGRPHGAGVAPGRVRPLCLHPGKGTACISDA